VQVFAVLLSVTAAWANTAGQVAALTPREKAAMLVVSSPPAPAGVGGVLLHSWEVDDPVPRRALVMVDQEGGAVRAYPQLPPEDAAAGYASARSARAAGRAAGRALDGAGVDVDLAPVVDSPDGPLGSRHFRRASYAVAFARGLAAAGIAACAKHFPGLGSTTISTDSRVPVRGVVRAKELAGFRAAVRAGVPCVMMGHAIYRRLGPRPASLEPDAYALLRAQGFTGVTITDELGVLAWHASPGDLARQAVLAGADLVLFSSATSAGQAIGALVPLARRGALDRHVFRVVSFRERYL
jgi:beta-N-acetylhexosaminidase